MYLQFLTYFSHFEARAELGKCFGSPIFCSIFGGSEKVICFRNFLTFSKKGNNFISGEEDLDEAGILRRRELMRQRALARAQIGMGQEEVMAKEEEKEQSASENEEETTEEETTDSEVGSNA